MKLFETKIENNACNNMPKDHYKPKKWEMRLMYIECNETMPYKN